MAEAGAELTVHYSAMAFMGFLEVVKNISTISRYSKQCKADILEFKPDVVILVDYAGFNMRIAKFAKENGLKVFYYISPKIWAWYTARAKQLRRTVDEMFVILPFEKDFFARYDWKVHYVGNPVLDAVKAHQPDPEFFSRYRLSTSETIIALLPGSRKQELQKMIPLMVSIVNRFPQYRFCVATVNNLNPALYDDLRSLRNVTLVAEDTYNLLGNSIAAVVTSGTATLETALLRVPQAVVYKTSPFTYRLVKWIIKVDYISLVNLIAGKPVIRELIQEDASTEVVSAELQKLVDDRDYRAEMISHYDSIIDQLDTGSASHNAAAIMVERLSREV